MLRTLLVTLYLSRSTQHSLNIDIIKTNPCFYNVVCIYQFCIVVGKFIWTISSHYFSMFFPKLIEYFSRNAVMLFPCNYFSGCQMPSLGDVKSSARRNHFKRQRSLIVKHKRSRILMTGHDDYGLLCKKLGGGSTLTCSTIENCTKPWRLIGLMLTPFPGVYLNPSLGTVSATLPWQREFVAIWAPFIPSIHLRQLNKYSSR